MNKSLFLALTLLGLLVARAGEGNALWDSAGSLGGWRAFGGGMLGAQAQSGEVKMAVNWEETTFGVGAVYENNLPALAPMKRLVVEARVSEADGSILAPEWVAGEKAFRVAPDRPATLTTEWETYSFEVPADFPRLSAEEATVTALRLLFVNAAKSGRADVYFRNARLEP